MDGHVIMYYVIEYVADCSSSLTTGGYPETYQILILTLQSFRPAVIEVPKSQVCVSILDRYVCPS